MSISIFQPFALVPVRPALWVRFLAIICLAGCVDAPEPATAFTSLDEEATASETPSEQDAVALSNVSAKSTDQAAVAEPAAPHPADPAPTPLAAEPDTGSAPTPSPLPAPFVTQSYAGSTMLAPPEPFPAQDAVPEPLPSEEVREPLPLRQLPAEPTLAVDPPSTPEATPTASEPEPTPLPDMQSANLTPGYLSNAPAETSNEAAAPLPFPTDSPVASVSASPATAPVELPDATPPTVVSPAGQPVPNANDKPLDLARPKPLIHLSPRQLPKSITETAPGTGSLNATEGATLPAAEAPVTAPPFPGNESLSSSETAHGAAALPTEPVADASLTQTAEISQEIPPAGTPVASASVSSESPTVSAFTPPTGFTALFPNQDLTGWDVYDGKTESWQFKDGLVSCVAPGGGWLQTQTMYSDFEMQFDYRLSAGGNSGVSVRFPGQGNPSLHGLEIQLLDEQSEKYQTIQPEQATGSLYFVKAPVLRDAAHGNGEWNHCLLSCRGSLLQVILNEKLVNEIDLSQMDTKVAGVSKPISSIRSPMGTIALQSHSTRVDFRNVSLRDLTQALPTGVRWLDLKEGIGGAVPPEAKVTVHYIGHLATGRRFANSIDKGKPTTVMLKDVIPGWREGIPGMKVGGKRRLIVPAEMAYGAKGFKEIIPPNSTLVYEIELIGFDQPAESPKADTPPPSASAETETSPPK